MQVAYKKRQRAKKRKEMELLMRDNLLNILTVPGGWEGITLRHSLLGMVRERRSFDVSQFV